MAYDKTVYLVDDDEAVRRSASFMLRTSGYLVKTFGSGVDFLSQAGGLPEGCVLLDVRMPEMDGLQVQAAMLDRGVMLPVIVLTGHGDIAIAVQAMKGGAVDFIEKPFEKSVLVTALEEGFARLQDKGRRDAGVKAANARLEKLTTREREVLEGLANGHPNKIIAHHLGISPRTVEIHRANVMIKLEVCSLSDALRIAFAAGS